MRARNLILAAAAAAALTLGLAAGSSESARADEYTDSAGLQLTQSTVDNRLRDMGAAMVLAEDAPMVVAPRTVDPMEIAVAYAAAAKPEPVLLALAGPATSPQSNTGSSPAPTTLPTVSFPATTYTEPPHTTGEAFERALEAGSRSQWSALVVLLLMTLVGGIRLLVAPVRNSKVMGWIANLALGFLGTLGLALELGVPFSWSLGLQSFLTALTAAGGWQFLKDVGAAPSALTKDAPKSPPPVPALRREV